MNFNLELAGRRALVTGGTKGVGAAVVESFRHLGMEVIAAARSVPDTAPAGVTYIAADLTTMEGCQVVANSVLERFGSIDVIVNVLGGSSAPHPSRARNM